MVEFDSMVQGKIDSKKLQARKDLGIPLALAQKGVGSRQNGQKRFGRASSLRSLKRPRYDKDYSSEDICCPLVKGSHKEGSPNRTTGFLHMKYLVVIEDLSWKKCSKELTWQMKDTWVGVISGIGTHLSIDS
jgi:hypothetical protein